MKQSCQARFAGTRKKTKPNKTQHHAGGEGYSRVCVMLKGREGGGSAPADQHRRDIRPWGRTIGRLPGQRMSEA